MSVSGTKDIVRYVAGKIVELDNSISFEDALTKARYTVLIATELRKKVKSRHFTLWG